MENVQHPPSGDGAAESSTHSSPFVAPRVNGEFGEKGARRRTSTASRTIVSPLSLRPPRTIRFASDKNAWEPPIPEMRPPLGSPWRRGLPLPENSHGFGPYGASRATAIFFRICQETKSRGALPRPPPHGLLRAVPKSQLGRALDHHPYTKRISGRRPARPAERRPENPPPEGVGERGSQTSKLPPRSGRSSLTRKVRREDQRWGSAPPNTGCITRNQVTGKTNPSNLTLPRTKFVRGTG